MDLSDFLRPLATLGPFLLMLLLRPLELAAPVRADTGRAQIGLNAAIGALTLVAAGVAAFVVTDRLAALFPAPSSLSIAALPLPPVARFLIGFAAIDFAQYALHRVSHAVPWLWRLHRLHHEDEFVTASTGLLHHPLEGIVSFVTMLAFFLAFGVPVGAILVYNAVGALHGIFVHANIALPAKLDSALSLAIFTPSGHRLHHSRDSAEHNANFGQVFPWWDWLLRTLITRPAESGEAFEMGLPNSRRDRSPRIVAMLASPID